VAPPRTLAAALLLIPASAAPAQQLPSLIRNGSFEEGPGTRGFLNLAGGSTALPGWVVTGEGIDLVGAGYWTSSDGTYALDLDGSARSRTTPPHVRGGIAQSFATTAGKRYRVTFDLAGNPNRPPLKKPLRVTAAGQSAEFVFDATGKTGRSMGWLPQTWTFTARGDSTTLEFTSLTQSPQTGYGPAIDRVAVTLLDEGPLRVVESDREIAVSLGAEILFDTGESALRPAATAALEQLAALIREHPELPIEIEGHTDSVGTRAYNERLSRERAESVKRWLVSRAGVAEARMTTRGFGPARPVAPNGSAEGRQQNRRVEVRLRKQPPSRDSYQSDVLAYWYFVFAIAARETQHTDRRIVLRRWAVRWAECLGSCRGYLYDKGDSHELDPPRALSVLGPPSIA
jgi:choice-of-anchor C domain-containing protein